jgi:hypothetical protein
MNQAHEGPWQGRTAGFRKNFVRCLCAALDGVADRPAGMRGGGRTPVAYSILFQ